MPKNAGCNLCGKDDSVLIFRKAGKNLVKCKNCGFVYMNPTPDGTREVYEDEFYESETRNSIWEQKCRKRINLIQRYKKDGKLVDIGCSSGSFLEYAKNAGFAVYGIEPNKKHAEKAKSMLKTDNIYTGMLEDADLGTDFDIATIFHVLEHLLNPRAGLEKINAMLKKGGLLIIEVPNIASLNARRQKEKWWYAGIGHIYHFSPKTITLMLEKTGFSVLKIIPEGGFLAGKTDKAEKAISKYYRFLKPGVKLYHLISGILKLSDAMIIIAKKKDEK